MIHPKKYTLQNQYKLKTGIYIKDILLKKMSPNPAAIPEERPGFDAARRTPSASNESAIILEIAPNNHNKC